jgi:O-antigen ligase
VLLLVAALPFPLGANRDWIWPWFAVAAFGCGALFAAACALGRWAPAESLARSRVGVVLAVATLVAGLPHLLAPGAIDGVAPVDPAASARALLLQALGATLFVLVLGLCDSRRRLFAAALVVFAAGTVQAGWGVLMTLSGVEHGFFGPKFVNLGVATGTFVNRNHFAGCVAMAAALGVGLLAAQLGQGQAAGPSGWRAGLRGMAGILLGPRAWLRGALALAVIGLVMSASRMGNLSFFIALGIGAGAALLLWRPRPRALVWLFASLVAVDVALLGSWFGLERVAERVRQTTIEETAPAEGRDSDAERVRVSAATLDLWRAHPALGVGPGAFRSAFPAAKPAEVALFYDHAHNDWAQALAERGLIGALPWFALWVAALVAALRALAKRRDPRLRGLALGTTMALGAAIAHGFVDFNGQIPSNASWHWVLLALAFGAARLPRGRGKDL